MDPSGDSQNAPAAHQSHIPISGDTSAHLIKTSFPQQPRDRGSAVPSPPLEPGYHERDPDLQSPPLTVFPIANSPNYLDGEVNRPPTPPRQDDEEFSRLREWYVQEGHGLNSSGLQQIEPQIIPGYAQLSLPPPPPPPPPQQQQQQPDYAARHYVNHFEEPYNSPPLRYSPEDLQREPSHFQTRFVKQHHIAPPRLSSIANYFQESPHSPYPLALQNHAHIPPIQQWPTRTLTHQDGRSELTPTGLASVPPPPSRKKVDEETRRKQETYRRKGEALRQVLSVRTQAAPQPDQRMILGSKRKLSPTSNTLLSPPTIAPPLRYLHPQSDQAMAAPQFTYMDGQLMVWNHALQCYVPCTLQQDDYYTAPISHPPSQYTTLPQAPGPQSWDDVDQPMNGTYEDYKWSVKLYELDPDKGYDFAQSFLEDLFHMKKLYEKDSSYKWHAHITHGFIKDGNHLSFIVLHNAVNPFTWGMPPQSTTTIGVYGRYGHEQDKQIFWKTFAPDIRQHLQDTMERRYFTLKHQWRVDMEKASDKRFHRAYWLAANMRPLKGLLNHNLPQEKSHDAVDDDEQFPISVADFQDSYDDGDIPYEEAMEAWRKILQENEDMDGIDQGKEHFIVGCSEWDLEGG